MEIDDFAWFLTMTAIMSFPFGIIYLILNTLNWNERKNIFSNCWFVFIAWLLSSLSMALIYALIDNKFYFSNSLFLFAFFIPSLIAANICAVAGVLYFKSRPKNSVILTNHNDDNIKVPTMRKIWQTSALVSILTLLMVIGLIVAINDITEKLSPKNPEGISFGIYDI
jgi:hypothetical protein